MDELRAVSIHRAKFWTIVTCGLNNSSYLRRIKNAGTLFRTRFGKNKNLSRYIVSSFSFLKKKKEKNGPILLLTSSFPISLGDVFVERIGHVRDVVRLFPTANKVHCHTGRLERCQYSLGDRWHFVEFEQGRVHVHERHLNKLRKKERKRNKKKEWILLWKIVKFRRVDRRSALNNHFQS